MNHKENLYHLVKTFNPSDMDKLINELDGYIRGQNEEFYKIRPGWIIAFFGLLSAAFAFLIGLAMTQATHINFLENDREIIYGEALEQVRKCNAKKYQLLR